nr:ribonuclease H-like domain-containing protein [Tanacetum cinerariifolium]
MSYLTEYEEIDRGYVAFGRNPKGEKITGKSTIKTDHLGKFDGKADEGFFVRYSLNSKTFRVFNNRTRIVEENLHIRFSESTPIVVGSGPYWLFDIDALIRKMNYEPIVAVLKSSNDDGSKPSSDDGKKVDEDPRKESKYNELLFDPNMPSLEDVIIFNFSSDDEDDGITYYCWVNVNVVEDGKEIVITESSVGRDLQLADEEDEVVHKELGDSLVRATTIASTLGAEQNSANVTKTQSKATPNESSSQGTNSGGGPRGNEVVLWTLGKKSM